jgi:hypothetical protein
MTTNLPLTGTYTGGISLLYNGQRAHIALVMKRTSPSLPISLGEIPTVAYGLGFGARCDVNL